MLWYYTNLFLNFCQSKLLKDTLTIVWFSFAWSSISNCSCIVILNSDASLFNDYISIGSLFTCCNNTICLFCSFVEIKPFQRQKVNFFTVGSITNCLIFFPDRWRLKIKSGHLWTDLISLSIGFVNLVINLWLAICYLHSQVFVTIHQIHYQNWI